MRMLEDGEIASLQAMFERLRASRPEGRGREQVAHFALEDAMSGVIALGQGVTSCAGDFDAAAKGVRRVVRMSDDD